MQYRRYGKVLNRTKFDPNEIILESDMAKIVLYNKNGDKIAEALIDTEDIGKISSDKWCIDKNNYVKNQNKNIYIELYWEHLKICVQTILMEILQIIGKITLEFVQIEKIQVIELNQELIILQGYQE